MPLLASRALKAAWMVGFWMFREIPSRRSHVSFRRRYVVNIFCSSYPKRATLQSGPRSEHHSTRYMTFRLRQKYHNDTGADAYAALECPFNKMLLRGLTTLAAFERKTCEAGNEMSSD